MDGARRGSDGVILVFTQLHVEHEGSYGDLIECGTMDEAQAVVAEFIKDRDPAAYDWKIIMGDVHLEAA